MRLLGTPTSIKRNSILYTVYYLTLDIVSTFNKLQFIVDALSKLIYEGWKFRKLHIQ
jgi:hypothetical protein